MIVDCDFSSQIVHLLQSSSCISSGYLGQTFYVVVCYFLNGFRFSELMAWILKSIKTFHPFRPLVRSSRDWKTQEQS